MVTVHIISEVGNAFSIKEQLRGLFAFIVL